MISPRALRRITRFTSFWFAFGFLAGFAAAQPAPNPMNRPGPWDNDLLVYRLATNQRAEQIARFERAGVGTVSRLRDGRLIAAHQYFPAERGPDFDKVAVRFSTNEGQAWTAPEVVRLGGLPEGMRFPFDPTLVALPDGRVRLYFTSLRGRRFEEDRPAIYSAISTNGLEYQVEPGTRFAVTNRPVIDCAVVLHQGIFHLYAPDNGAGMPPGNPRTDRGSEPERSRDGAGYHAVSRDGLTFTRAPEVQIDGRRRWLGNAQSDGQRITFFGTGDGGVWRATSSDGQNWSAAQTLEGVRAADPGAVSLKDGSLLVIGTGPLRPETPSARGRRADQPTR